MKQMQACMSYALRQSCRRYGARGPEVRRLQETYQAFNRRMLPRLTCARTATDTISKGTFASKSGQTCRRKVALGQFERHAQ